MENNGNPQQLWVNLAEKTGPVRHGAVGFLYGLGKAEVPSVNVLAPLHPQVAAQKPENGLQHSNGDALNVSDTYRAAGGKEIEIYMQDMYPNWPYNALGLEDYLEKIPPMIQAVLDSPNRSLFSWVPFNEPDQIWYNNTDRRQAFLEDWGVVYRKIKSMDPAARIVGPNFANYDSDFYRDFFTFARDHDCLPDVTSWHELNDGFFAGWYERYADYRAIEASLGIAPREICINEYCRISGDLSVPGKQIQWLTRFENSKVDACLAYWTDAGSLNNLVTRDNAYQATGAWWLYRWYAGLSGETVTVTPPDALAEGLQGVAALDLEKRQTRLLLGGVSGAVDVIVDQIPAEFVRENQVHVSVWATPATGFASSTGPTLALESNYVVKDGQIQVRLEDLVDTSAYQMTITPGQDALLGGHELAIFADLLGDAMPCYMPEGAYVELGAQAGVTFVVAVEKNGYYTLRLNCAAAPQQDIEVQAALNGQALLRLPVSAIAAETCVFLPVGVNSITFTQVGGTEKLQIASLATAPGKGLVRAYEAEAAENLLSGTAAVIDADQASGGKAVSEIGGGEENALEFRQVKVEQAGVYHLVITFANAEFRGEHSYNSQIVDRSAELCVNGGSPQRLYFRNTFDWENYQTRVVDVNLEAGENSLKFMNRESGAFAPRIDKIEIAAPFGDL